MIEAVAEAESRGATGTNSVSTTSYQQWPKNNQFWISFFFFNEDQLDLQAEMVDYQQSSFKSVTFSLCFYKNLLTNHNSWREAR